MLPNSPRDPETGSPPQAGGPAGPSDDISRIRREAQRNLVIVFALGTAGLVAVGCSIAISRDLSAVPVGQVGFDDMCGLQDYFDALEIHYLAAPADRERARSRRRPERQGEGRSRRAGAIRVRERFPAQAPAPGLEPELATVARRASDGEHHRDRGEVVGEGRHEARRHRPGGRDLHRPAELGPSVSRLPLGAALRRAALPSAADVLWGLPLPGQPAKPSSLPPARRSLFRCGSGRRRWMAAPAVGTSPRPDDGRHLSRALKSRRATAGTTPGPRTGRPGQRRPGTGRRGSARAGACPHCAIAGRRAR